MLVRVVLGVLCLASAVEAQVLPIYEFDGAASDDMGTDVAIANVDQDAYGDMIIGIPRRFGNNRGEVRVLSGFGGGEICTLEGFLTDDRLGTSIAVVGDQDEDGIDDFVVGAPQVSALTPGPGFVRLVSGADCSVLCTYSGLANGDRFGWDVAAIGDLSGDGKPEILVGAPQTGAGGSAAGYTLIFTYDQSLEDCLFLSGSASAIPDDRYGFSVSAVSPLSSSNLDVNSDGIPDYIVGAPGDDSGGAGYVRVISGADDSTIAEQSGQPNDAFGAEVLMIPDWNDDGVADYAVGIPRSNAFPAPAGSVVVYSSLDPVTPLSVFDGESISDQFGTSLATADFDQDGRSDLAIGARLADGLESDSGRVSIFLRDALDVPLTFSGQSVGERFGISMSTGDIDADGVVDLIAGGEDAPSFGGIARALSLSLELPLESTGDAIGQKRAFVQHYGFEPGAQLGRSVAILGDIDLDGHADYAASRVVDGLGQVRVYSGKTGLIMHTLSSNVTPPAATDDYGAIIEPLGDIDGDGNLEYAVTQPDFDSTSALNVGRVQLYTLNTDTPYVELVGTAINQRLGLDVDVIDDMNGDGLEDILVLGGNVAQIYSGVTGALIKGFGAQGSVIAALDDIDSDGTADFAIGSPDALDGNGIESGTVMLRSGANGAIILILTGSEEGDEFGFAIEAMPDLDGDGLGDIAIGAPNADSGPDSLQTDAGAVFVHSTNSGAELRRWNGQGNGFGSEFALIADQNGDQVDDIVITNPDDLILNTGGVVHIFSSLSGEALDLISDDPGLFGTLPESWGFGNRIATGGDIDLDGHEDLLITAIDPAPTDIADARGLVRIEYLNRKSVVAFQRNNARIDQDTEINFELDIDNQYAGWFYVTLAGASGTSPGLVIDGTPIPINYDFLSVAWLQGMIAGPTIGILDSAGTAQLQIDFPAQDPIAASSVYSFFTQANIHITVLLLNPMTAQIEVVSVPSFIVFEPPQP